MIELKSPRELDLMRAAGRVVAAALASVSAAVAPGATTADLDRLAEETIRRHGAVPAFLGYRGFPRSICTSVNDEVVHGIPGPRILENGDIVSVDVGAELDGYFGDAAATFPVGEVSRTARRLLAATAGALARGIAAARVGNRLSDIGHAIQAYAEGAGFAVVTDYVGHGIGRQLHEEPQVPNFGPPGRGPLLVEGMVLAIEPMVNAGTGAVRRLDDGWTVVTRDGGLSAHFEHTVAITAAGPEILTGEAGPAGSGA